MRLSSLIASSDGLKSSGPDPDIAGLATDSRKIKSGFLFIAVPGTKEDGRAYIKQAIKNGAVAVVLPEGSEPLSGVAVITAQNIRTATAQLASRFYARQPEMIAAITGTSGKTSVAQFAREIWQACGVKSASIGTLGLVTNEETRYAGLTTPDSILLHQMLDECADKGITHLALEASSHGLDLRRLEQVRVKIAAFTNFSRDHLDYHRTMEDYLAAKLRLFTDIVATDGIAVLNVDDPAFDAFLKAASARGLKIFSYGRQGKGIRLIDVEADPKGQKLKFEISGKVYEAFMPVLGDFQVSNALCALGIAIASGIETDKAVAALGQLTGVPGRLQFVGHSKTGGSVFVDYAHKPDALENILKAVRPHAHQGKLGVVFGCGGDRDTGKRPVMGEIAQRLADWVIVTDDNPRHENAAQIRREILAGCKKEPKVLEIADRSEAIRSGIGKLQKNDILIVAGKGHESGQIIGDTTLPFDDFEITQKVLAE